MSEGFLDCLKSERDLTVKPMLIGEKNSIQLNPRLKTVAEKLSFILCIWPGNLLMNILRDSQLVIFSHSTIFITFSYKSLAGFLFKLLQSLTRRKPEVVLYFCIWPLCAHEYTKSNTAGSDNSRTTFHEVPLFETNVRSPKVLSLRFDITTSSHTHTHGFN